MIQVPKLTRVITSKFFWLVDAQLERLGPFFPLSHGTPRVGERRGLFEGTSHGLRPAGEKRGPDDRRGILIGRTKGGPNAKLRAVTDARGRPLKVFMTAGRVGDHTDAAALPGSLPAAEWLIADRRCEADRFREASK